MGVGADSTPAGPLSLCAFQHHAPGCPEPPESTRLSCSIRKEDQCGPTEGACTLGRAPAGK